jgi:hypothetical protein
MVFKKCKVCGELFDETNKRCPKCKRRIILYVMFSVSIILIILILAHQLSDNSSSTSSTPLPSTIEKTVEVTPPSIPAVKPTLRYTFNGYTLNNREENVLKALLLYDFYGYIDGRGSNPTLAPIWQVQLTNIVNVKTSADELQNDYERNEVAADLKYRRQTLFVTGIVTSISRGIGENYYISLRGGRDMFMGPHASMSDGFVNYLADLQKGQIVHLVCQCSGMFVGSAMLRDCKPINVFSETIINNYIRSMSNKLSNKDNTSKFLIIDSIAVASNLSDSSDCFGTFNDQNNNCIADIRNTMEEIQKDESKYKVALDKLHIHQPKFNKDITSPPEEKKYEINE